MIKIKKKLNLEDLTEGQVMIGCNFLFDFDCRYLCEVSEEGGGGEQWMYGQ